MQPNNQQTPPYRPPSQPQPNNQPLPQKSQPTQPIYTPPVPKNNSNKKERKNAIYTVLLFVLAVVFPIFLIIFVLQSYIVDGSSMTPTLQSGNRVFIYKLPKTISNFRPGEYIPSRNEVIVFKKPSDNSTQLIKRVIGLPGERVVVKDNTVRVYNAENPDGFDPDAGTDYGDKLAQTDTGTQVTDITVGENELFVMGDNRTPGGSLDSHSGLGLVPVQNIVGRLWIRYFPLSEFKVFANTKLQFTGYLVPDLF